MTEHKYHALSIDRKDLIAYFTANETTLKKALMSNSNDDITIVTKTRVSCDGGGGALGHPKTYLDMGQDSEVRCKYCDRVFKLDPKAVSAGH